MVKIKSMTRNKNHGDASSTTMRIKTCDNWSDLNHDLLLLVIMQLGVIDFLAFSGVCKSWRLLALSNKKKFMVSIPPMSISISTDANAKEKVCYLEDFDRRKFKTIIPHSADRTFIGVTCGYLILFSEKTRDFWLVNPVTKHQLYFPVIPFKYHYVTDSFKGILVFSRSTSKWVFVLLSRPSYIIWFSIAGTQKWTRVPTLCYYLDLFAFKGKIYARHFSNSVSEVRLFPTPKVTLLESMNIRKPNFTHPMLVSWGENLYVIDRFAKHPHKIHELNFAKMKWVSCEEIGENYAFFFSGLANGAGVILKEPWADLHLQYRRYAFTDLSAKKNTFYANSWYFFQDNLNVSHI